MDVIALMSSFWTTRTGQTKLPGGRMHSARGVGREFPATDTLHFDSSFESPIALVFRGKCQITKHHPLLDQIKALHLVEDRTGPSLGDRDGSGSAYMTHLERIMLEDPSTAKQLQSIEKLVKEHSRLGRPI
jgi:hypothetical protein